MGIRSKGYSIGRIGKSSRTKCISFCPRDEKPDAVSHYRGGGGEIRTLETLAGLAVFKTTGINHYPTPPNSQS